MKTWKYIDQQGNEWTVEAICLVSGSSDWGVSIKIKSVTIAAFFMSKYGASPTLQECLVKWHETMLNISFIMVGEAKEVQ